MGIEIKLMLTFAVVFLLGILLAQNSERDPKSLRIITGIIVIVGLIGTLVSVFYVIWTL
jgi:hypothetical protein